MPICLFLQQELWNHLLNYYKENKVLVEGNELACKFKDQRMFFSVKKLFIKEIERLKNVLCCFCRSVEQHERKYDSV